MIILLWLSLALVPWLLGAGILAALRGRKGAAGVIHMTDAWIMGSMCCVGLAQALHLLGTFGHMPLSRLTPLWHVGIAALCILASVPVAITWRRHRERFRLLPQNGGSFVLPGIFLLLALLQVVYVYCMPAIIAPGDIMTETVRSFQAADGIYLVNPLTGQAYTQGMSMRYRVLGLPTLYTFLSVSFSVDSGLLVQNLIPVAVIAGAYMVYYRLARQLFEDDLKKKYLMLILVSLIFWCGEGAVWLDGYAALHGAWLGTSIRNLILLPYALSLGLQKDPRRTWPGMLLCVLTEACVCWTFNGLGLCLLLLAVMTVLGRIGSSRLHRRLAARISGREEAGG
ncbi:MAG: hypothetical protein K1W26_11265 [Acetatifactor sp.]